MISNEKVVNYKVAYIFHFCCFSIWGHLKNSTFKCEKFKHSFPWQDDFKWKSCQLQSCITFWDLQLLFWLFLHHIWGHLENSNFKFEKFKRNFPWKMISKKSCHLQSSITFILVISPSKVLWKFQILVFNFYYSASIYRCGSIFSYPCKS
jgi:hypothetical protein